MSPRIDQNTSRIFNLLKVLSIFMVMIGHFFKEYGLLWVPVAVGLLIFSFSSGYFTALKYTGDFSWKNYWKKKIERLGMSLLVVNFALLILFLIQGRSGIWSWYSIVNIAGLNGLLNWFRIPDPSPFGERMWFFTLLLIFYLCYPFLEKMNQKTFSVFTALFIAAAFLLSCNIIYGHALWLTACGFIIGVWAAKNAILLPPNISRITAIAIFTAMTAVNFIFNIKTLNFFFILFFSIFLIYACRDITVRDWVDKGAVFFSGCILEIYLIHGYFFMTPTHNRIIDFLLSLLTIILMAKILSMIASKLNHTFIKAST
ncbi:acyltransferase family protein [Desulfobacter postgatei]|uniref:Acyltransferase family protein n=1 Tax=Desulfobacter postgatei 2ac9 TaxID=879212 RepID=I5B271_9BACT|nr:acyltransferase family protein [Desulfobacter postgatei]EIM63584.1 acyltransferase family protein [Desulfobacter postgatei 2ac9]